MCNYLGIQMMSAWPDARVSPLSSVCRRILGVGSRRLQEEGSPPLPELFTLSVDWGADSVVGKQDTILEYEEDIIEVVLNETKHNEDIMLAAIKQIQSDVAKIMRSVGGGKRPKAQKADATNLFEPSEAANGEGLNDDVAGNNNARRLEGATKPCAVESTVEQQVGAMQGKVDAVEGKVDAVEDKINDLSTEMKEMKAMISQLIAQNQELTQQVRASARD